MSTIKFIRGLGLALAAVGLIGGGLALTGCGWEDWYHHHGGKKGPPPPPPPPAAAFQVTQCALGSGAWVPPGAAKGKPTFRVSFTQPVNFSTMSVPKTVRVVMTAPIPGGPGAGILPKATLFPSPDHKTVVIVSALTDQQVLLMLGGNPAKIPGGANVNYQMLLLGTDDKGSGFIRDATGHALDGNFDGKPGGVYSFSLNEHLKW